MSEHTSTTSGMHDVISMGAISLGMRRKYAGVKKEFGNPNAALQPLNADNAVDPDGDDPEGPRAFTSTPNTPVAP